MNCGHLKTTMNFQFYKTSLSIMETLVLVQKSKFKMTTMEANQHIWHPLHRTMVTADHWPMVNCRETANRLGIQRTPWSNIITRNINQSKRIGCKPQLSISQSALNGELSLPIKIIIQLNLGMRSPLRRHRFLWWTTGWNIFIVSFLVVSAYHPISVDIDFNQTIWCDSPRKFGSMRIPILNGGIFATISATQGAHKFNFGNFS